MFFIKVFKKLFDGAALYLPPLLFGILAPILVFKFENPSEIMLGFYAATFGVGMLSSGFSHATQHILQKHKSIAKVLQFTNSYLISRVILCVPVFLISGTLTIFEYEYTSQIIILLITSSLPTWSLLYLLGSNRLPKLLSWIENILKLVVVYISLINGEPIWNFLYVASAINILVWIAICLKHKNFCVMGIKQFVRYYFTFVSSGLLFSVSWLAFMSFVLTSSAVNTPLIVFLERSLRILERAHTIIATIIFRRSGGVSLTSEQSKKVKTWISWSIGPVLIVLLATYIGLSAVEALFVLSLFLILLGQVAQQLLKPNQVYNWGEILQAFVLLTPIMLFPTLRVYTAELFLLGGFVNYLVRRKAVI